MTCIKGAGTGGDGKGGGGGSTVTWITWQWRIPSASRLDDDSEPNDVTILNSVYAWYVSLVPCTLIIDDDDHGLDDEMMTQVQIQLVLEKIN